MGIENNILPEDRPDNKEPMVPLSEVLAVIADLKQMFITADEARAIVKEELPAEFRNLDSFPNTSANKQAGCVLKLGEGAPGIPATAYWGTEGGGTEPAVEYADAFTIKEITGFSAIFYGGPVIKGTVFIGEAGEQTCTITETGQIVYVVYTLATGGISFGIANAANFPVSASGTYVKALQSFTLTAETIVPLVTYHRGVIQIDGMYS
ncbi:MAG: hypothetical protein WC359_12645 [Dehalococcoidia bacterium]|jgi:hypothetical protein